MHLIPFKIYENQIQVYDDLYKNNRSSYYQRPILTSIIISLNLQNVKFKYILYSILFLNMITLQKPYLSFGKQVKINLNLQKGSFIGCKICLRKENMYLFLNMLILNIFPKMNLLNFFKKPVKKTLLFDSSFTFHIKDLSKYYQEIELFYPFFQTIEFLGITIHFSDKLPLNQLISRLYLPLIIKKN